MAMMKQWYIQIDDECQGPHELTEVRQLIDAHRIGADAWFGCDDVWIDFDSFRKSWSDEKPDSEDRTVFSFPASAARALAKHASGETAAPQPPSDGAPRELPVTTDSAKETPVRSVVGQAADGDSPPRINRDVILLLGRRRAGKTVYLATLYSMLWRAVRGVTLRALSGQTHKMLMSVAGELKDGKWPEATLGSQEMSFELDDKGRKVLLIAIDYSGEDFTRAFVDEETDSPEVKRLLGYVDKAACVILLIDPAVALSGRTDEVVDDDFGMVQAVRRIRDRHGGEEVPVVLAFTKIDRNDKLRRRGSSAKKFVLQHYPALARTLGRIPIFRISAVQEVLDGDGSVKPSPNSTPVDVASPLLYCLNVLQDQEKVKDRETAERAAQEAHRAQRQLEEENIIRAKRRVRIRLGCFLAICTLGVVAWTVYLLYF